VLFGRLVSSTDLPMGRQLDFEVIGSPHKISAIHSGELQSGDIVHYMTELSTAACGITPVPDATYILFAEKIPTQPGKLWLNSCNGSRVHLSETVPEPQGFRDVPPRFVAQQLNALSGVEVLQNVSANQPAANKPDNTTLIGLLDLKSLVHGGIVVVHADPTDTALVTRRVSSYRSLTTREVGYELPAAVVFSIVNGWYRIKLADGSFGWVSPQQAGTYYPYADLPVRHLAYLTEHWSGYVWPAAGAGLPLRHPLNRPPDRQEYAAEIQESMLIGGMVWFHVTVLKESPCTGEQNTAVLSGWVPGYGADGQPTVWYYSRGC